MITKVERYRYYIPRTRGPSRSGERAYKQHILPTLKGDETVDDLREMLPEASEILREHYRNDHLSRAHTLKLLNLICLTEYLTRIGGEYGD